MSEVLQELEAASKQRKSADGYHTVNEMMAATGWGQAKTRKAMLALKAQGRLTMARVDRENLAGSLQPTIAYRILPAKRGKR